jgi:hypothetical protein
MDIEVFLEEPFQLGGIDRFRAAFNETDPAPFVGRRREFKRQAPQPFRGHVYLDHGLTLPPRSCLE